MAETFPPPQAGEASQLVARLRVEHAAQEGAEAKAALLHECGAALERGGDEGLAAREYLAAFNAAPDFREPLEALVGILSRRKSAKNLGKLLDALARAAETPEERARAHGERAAFLLDHEGDVEGAQSALEEAVGAYPEDASAWLEIELIAARIGDESARAQALEARAELATDPTYKGLLYVEIAELAVRAGSFERAYELLDAAGALEGRARFRSRLALEQAALREPNLEVLARALEGQAELVSEALEDPVAGDAAGVPKRSRRPEVAADAFFRAADLLRRSGDLQGASSLLARAAERLPDSAVVARARVTALEAAGDAEGAAAVARKEIERTGGRGPGGAALWLRVAEAAAIAGSRGEALVALRAALESDPGSIPARALEHDLAGDGEDPLAFAISLAAGASVLPTAEGRARAHLLESYVWASQLGDVPSAKDALDRSGKEGASAETRARVGRMLASRRKDAAWYEEATVALLASPLEGGSADAPEGGERASLLFELGRLRLLRGDAAGAREALLELGKLGEAAPNAPAGPVWLGRALAAYARPAGEGEGGEAPPPEPLVALAEVEPDPELARARSLAAALRATRRGDAARAREILAGLHESDASDLVAGVFLAELRRREGGLAAAAEILARVASASDEEEVSAALHLEAALLLWRSGDRAAALAAIESARLRAPKAGATLLRWALAAAGPSAERSAEKSAEKSSDRSLDAGRRALDVGAELGESSAWLALARFGLEVSGLQKGGELLEALSALEAAERAGRGELAVAAALGRLALTAAREEPGAEEAAFDVLGREGGEAGEALASAERLRLARAAGDAEAAARFAARWASVEPGAESALEWLAAASAAEDREGEASAREALAAALGEACAGPLLASAASLRLRGAEAGARGDLPLLPGGDAATQLMNLELAPPGADPRRRYAALRALGDCLGDEAQLDALALSGWNALARGEPVDALAAFEAVVAVRAGDLASWEGVRASAESLGDRAAEARASAELGALCRDDARGAAFWERAGLLWLEEGTREDEARAAHAFDRAFARSPLRAVAFDKLFRRLRDAGEDDRLLEVTDRRLLVADDEDEIAKLFWERARVLRKKGDMEGAMAAIENVTMLAPDHVGALALAGEICIAKGDFAGAAPLLARLASNEAAPAQLRLMNGVAAVDIYEKRLGMPERALEVLSALHRGGLSNVKVRERLAKVAGMIGAWDEAIAVLELLMRERETREGRVEAARLAMAIWRDKKREPARASAAVERLLSEAPDDAEAIDLVLSAGFDPSLSGRLLGRAKAELLARLAENPTDGARVSTLSKIAAGGGDVPLRQATLGALVALGGGGAEASAELARIDPRVPARPQTVLGPDGLAEIADPEDRGPLADLFALLGETLSLAIGPGLGTLGVGRRERVESRGGHPLRLAVAEWMGALGLSGDFELYVGGPDPGGVVGVMGEEPCLVVGSAVRAPFDAPTRMAVAREVFALRRGFSALRRADDAVLASAVAAACQEAGVGVPQPPYSGYSEIARSVHKEISRRVRKAIAEPAARFSASGQDVRAYAAAARRSLDRMSAIAAGDVSLVLSAELGVPRDALASAVRESERARSLLRFVLSPSYLELRSRLGMGAR